VNLIKVHYMNGCRHHNETLVQLIYVNKNFKIKLYEYVRGSHVLY
jgi:hypothetical protein